MAHSQAVEAYLTLHSELPANVKFVFEGEEEVGSPYLEKFLVKHADLLAADLVLSADCGQISEKQPGIPLGFRCCCNSCFAWSQQTCVSCVTSQWQLQNVQAFAVRWRHVFAPCKG